MKRTLSTLLLALPFAVALTLLRGCAAEAQEDPAFIAKRAAGQLEAARNALFLAQDSNDRVAALTRTIRAYEEGLKALREGVRRAAIREEALRQRFEAERDRLSRLLGVLQAIEISPAPLLLLHPSGPIGSARSGMIVSDIAPGLQREADKLRADGVEATHTNYEGMVHVFFQLGPICDAGARAVTEVAEAAKHALRS